MSDGLPARERRALKASKYGRPKDNTGAKQYNLDDACPALKLFEDSSPFLGGHCGMEVGICLYQLGLPSANQESGHECKGYPTSGANQFERS